VNKSDFPTATKSNFYDYSPLGRDLASPSRNAGKAKMQEAKNSINTIINEVNTKKMKNAEAIERIRQINAEAMGSFNTEDGQSYTPHRTYTEGQTNQPRSYVGGQISPINNDGYGSDYNMGGGGDNVQYDGGNQNRNVSLEQENIELRRALN
jgi:hypothetical protein